MLNLMQIMTKNFQQKCSKFICIHRENIILNFLYKISKKYIMSYDNYNYEFDDNGEKWLLEKISAEKIPIKTIFDVGSNIGQWAILSSKYFPKAKIDSFELSPYTFSRLAKETSKYSNIQIHNFGFSNISAKTTFNQYPDYPDGTPSGRTSLFEHGDETPTLGMGFLERGDDIANKLSITKIDFLKIDVEGAEHLVLEGFAECIQRKYFKFIQFERACAGGGAGVSNSILIF